MGVSLALLNGKVWTGCADHPRASAVAVANGRIVAVGADRDIEALVPAETKVIDLAGGRVLPGFRDSHVHFVAGGFLLRQVNLRDAGSAEAFGRRLADFASDLPPGEWVLGGNWDEHRSLGGKLPDRAMLDRFVPGRPVFVRRYDGHVAACNSRALELAGIGAAAPDPPGGRIDRDAAGGPTGILRDAAMRLVAEEEPQPSRRQVAQALILGETSELIVVAALEMGMPVIETLHSVSESPAIRRQAELLAERLPGLPVRYVPSGALAFGQSAP